MRLVLPFTAFLLIQVVAFTALSAENPVAYVCEISGEWIAVDSKGITAPLAVKSPIYNGSQVKRVSSEGRFRVIDRNCKVSPYQVEALVSFKDRPEIEASKQGPFLSYIGGTMTRGSKGATANEFLDWMQEIGTVMEQDIDKGFAIQFSRKDNSQMIGVFNPLVMKLNARYQVLSISYRVVQSTLVLAEGQLGQGGGNWVLRLRELQGQAGETIPLRLIFMVKDTQDGKEKQFAMEAPFTIMADDGFIEGEIKGMREKFLVGTDTPDLDMVEKLAKLAVYSEYDMYTYAMSIMAGK